MRAAGRSFLPKKARGLFWQPEWGAAVHGRPHFTRSLWRNAAKSRGRESRGISLLKREKKKRKREEREEVFIGFPDSKIILIHV
jgi:hypothetical protein